MIKKFIFFLTALSFLLVTLISAQAKISYRFSAIAPNTVRFTLTGNFNNCDISRTLLVWDFGDRTPVVKGKGKTSVQHSYSQPGTYQVKVYSSGSLNLNLTANFRPPCTVNERITIRIGQNTSGSSSSSVSSGVVTNHPISSATHFIAPLKLDLELVSVKPYQNKKAKILLRTKSWNRNFKGRIKLLKSPTRSLISQLPIFLPEGRLKTISFTVPLLPQESKYKAVIYDENRRPVKEVLIVVPAYKPSFFIIAGFRFDIDYQKGEAYCRLPFNLDYSVASISGIGSGVGLSPAIGVSLPSGGSGSASGSLIKVKLQDIGFDNFQLDQNNKVLRGSFEVGINRFLLLSNAKKAIFLKKISFTPSQAKAWFGLNLGDKFSLSFIEFSSVNINPHLSHGIVLQFSSPLQIKSSYDNKVSLSITQIKIHLNGNKILRTKLKSRINFGDGKILNGEGVIHFSSTQEGAGIFLSCKKMSSSGSQDVLQQIWQNMQPFWEKSINEKFSVIANEVALDWDPYFTPLYFKKAPSWTGSILKGVSLRVFVPLMTQTLSYVDFPCVNESVPYYYKDQMNSYKFSLKQDNFLILAIPKGFKLILKQGSNFILRGAQILSYLKAEIELPNEFESSSGNKVKASLGVIPDSFSVSNKRVVFNEAFVLKNNKNFKFKNIVGRLTLNSQGGFLSFEDGVIDFPIKGLNINAQGLVLDGLGFHGNVLYQGSPISIQYRDFPLYVSKVDLSINNFQITKAEVSGEIEFPILNHLRRNFKIYLLMEYTPIVVTKAPAQEEFTSTFFDIDPIQGIVISTKIGGQDITIANISSDVKLKLPFGVNTEFSSVPLNIGANGISSSSFPIGSIWDFNGISAQVQEGKITSKDGTVFFEVTPVFSLGQDWMSFPLSAPIKFSANGEVSGVEGAASVDVNIEKVVSFKGKGTLYFDTDYNFKIELNGKMKALKKKIEAQGYFLFHHRSHDFDYWRISGSVTGVKVPLDSQGTVIAKEFSGGLYYNMKCDFDLKKFECSYSPQADTIGFGGGMGISTRDEYVTYIKGAMSIELAGYGLDGGAIRVQGKAWMFKKKPSGDPPFRAYMEGVWGDNPHYMADIQGKLRIKKVLKMPAKDEYKDVVLYIDGSGLSLDAGTPGNPWTAKILEMIDGKAYLQVRINSSQVFGRAWYGFYLDKKAEKDIKIKKCKLVAALKGNLSGGAQITLVPNISYGEKGEVYLHVKAGLDCVSWLNISKELRFRKRVHAPSPWMYYLETTIDLPGWAEAMGFPDEITLGVDLLKPLNSVI